MPIPTEPDGGRLSYPPFVAVTSSCRSCGAKILWARTERGKKMPLDAKPVAKHDQSGVFVLRDMQNREGPLCIAAWGLDGTEDHYVSHFATCPDADQHRKKKS